MGFLRGFVDFFFGTTAFWGVVPVGLGGGLTLALAPKIRDIRLAHWFFGVGFVWAEGCFIREAALVNWQSKFVIPLVFVVSGLIGSLAWLTFKWVETHRLESTPAVATDSGAVSETQKELDEVNDFICKKDENELRSEFDFPAMLKYNVEFAKRNLAPNLIPAGESAAIDAFFLNGQARLDLRYANVKVINNRVNVDWIPGKIGVINTSKKYVDSRKTLSRLMSSAALPEDVTAALKLVDDAIEKNSVAMLESLNESLASDPRNILENDVYGTDHYGSASGLYWSRFIPLRPRADVVTLAVRKALGR